MSSGEIKFSERVDVEFGQNLKDVMPNGWAIQVDI